MVGSATDRSAPKPAKRSTNARSSDLPKLAKPAVRALDAAGIRNMDQLAKRSEVELLKLHGMGPNAILRLRAALAGVGKSFVSSP